MRIRRLWITDFRNHEHDELELPPGLTAVTGPNGAGKTALLEAIGFLSTLSSFRGAGGDLLVRSGQSSAVVRGELERDGRELLIECEITPGKTVVQLNRQRGARRRDLLDALRVSVFTPDDLVLVKGGPGERRRFLDDAMVQLAPRDDALRLELERVLRQRNTLLKQAGGRLTEEVGLTLDVWDQKLAAVGEEIGTRRTEIAAALVPLVAEAYDRLAGSPVEVGVGYRSSWAAWGGLADALAARREEDVKRRVSTVGPHRDDVELTLGGLPARTQASQGEQRSLALAMRLGVHRLVADRVGVAPVLLLDDVFSELDASHSRALVELLPEGQALLTTAGDLPAGIEPEQRLSLVGGRIVG
ncbi:MAG TPA: DNA replication/repair protein RecF [Acidimicrobiales bacterium]|nr:DNA replication/repair protein RecF [Acidimicrobiales bacterium]